MQLSPSNRAVVYVGARPPRNYRFIGTIYDVVVFSSLVTSDFVRQLMMDSMTSAGTTGECVSYLPRDAPCPVPSVAPSLYCRTRSQT